MKTALVLSGVLLLSCSQGRDAEPSDMDEVKAHRDFLCSTFDPNTVERCDRITFVALMSAACGKDYNLASYEENGKWARDSQPCYPEESKSECSLDGYLSVLHAAHALRLPVVPRMRASLEETDWLCGEGPESVTSIRPLKSIIERMSGASMTDEADASITGFRWHLLASYMWIKRKVYGSNNAVEKTALEVLYKDVPQSPFYAALAGDKRGAVEKLQLFPAPYSQFWGSAPDSTMYAASVAILEGK